jgi:hypothetical protein
VAGINELKRDVFTRFLDEAGKVFVLVRYSDAVRIGRRGFLPEERKDGMVLVFNRKMKFTWDGSGLHATLVFGDSPEKCFIPPEEITAIYSPELGAQFVVSPEAVDIRQEAGASGKGRRKRGRRRSESADNLIEVDFRRGDE